MTRMINDLSLKAIYITTIKNERGFIKMIVLYSTNCPRCNVLEAKLNAKGITFETNNNVDEMMDLGIMSVPVLSIDGNILQFKEAVDWVNAQEDSNED